LGKPIDNYQVEHQFDSTGPLHMKTLGVSSHD